MSTRASIIIRDEQDTLYFYRHSDGYPECAGKDLTEFVADYTSKAMRNNAGQSAGWLIVRGHNTYLEQTDFVDGKWVESKLAFTARPVSSDRGLGWKVGAYEPTTTLHGDVEYIYVIDLKARTLSCRVPTEGFWDTPTLENTKASRKFKTVRF